MIRKARPLATAQAALILKAAVPLLNPNPKAVVVTPKITAAEGTKKAV